MDKPSDAQVELLLHAIQKTLVVCTALAAEAPDELPRLSGDPEHSHRVGVAILHQMLRELQYGGSPRDVKKLVTKLRALLHEV